MTRFAGRVDAHLADGAKRRLTFDRPARRIVGRAARMRHDDDVARRIDARGDRVIDLARIVDVGIGADGHDDLGVEPRRAHRRHQRVVDEALARIVELQDAGQRAAPGREAHVLDFSPISVSRLYRTASWHSRGRVW